MITKMNTKKRHKVGDLSNLFLKIPLILIILYLVISLVCYIDSVTTDEITLHAMDRPFILYIATWISALSLVINIILVRKKTNLCYLFLNIFSILILFLSFMEVYCFLFYMNDIDRFTLEIIAIALIIITNSKAFIAKYHIRREKIYLLYIVIIPLIVTVCMYYLVRYMYFLV